MQFTAQDIQAQLDKRFTAFTPSPAFPIEKRLYKDDLPNVIKDAIAAYPLISEWHDVAQHDMATQQDMWLLRDWLNENIFYYVARKIKEAKDTSLDMVEIGNYSRQIPSGFDLSAYRFYSFGSSKVTSDIDVTIEGPHASFMIACLEDAWLTLTGEPSRVWDVEYYGDFLMFHDPAAGQVFLNSRRFDPYRDRIMPYVGVSILRNEVSLDSPEIDAFIAVHQELNSPGWKDKAKQLYNSVRNLDYQAMREQYYKDLARAESYKDSKLDAEKRHIETFLALAHANMFRSENYILPSTVIHVVRDIQAKSKAAEEKQCGLYTARLATCALGRFTYLASALEQLGYRLRFPGQPDKIKKYQDRLDNALSKAGSGGQRRSRKGRGSRRGKRPTKKAKRRSRYLRR